MDMSMMNQAMCRNKKTVLVTVGSAIGVTALGLGAVAIWNSRRLRAMRAAKRTGKLLYKMGTVLQSVSGVAEDM
ncbi:MAG: hypothetical protein IJW16_07520 [Clostridia bacterium]|nr:hypothetical protein [Clostridia bacterium]